MNTFDFFLRIEFVKIKYESFLFKILKCFLYGFQRVILRIALGIYENKKLKRGKLSLVITLATLT